MLRPSDLLTPSDFAVEHQREDIRDRRSLRYRMNVSETARALAMLTGSIASAGGLAHLLGWL